jgi:hypothetical protein
VSGDNPWIDVCKNGGILSKSSSLRGHLLACMTLCKIEIGWAHGIMMGGTKNDDSVPMYGDMSYG